jgi:hypothetical protein
MDRLFNGLLLTNVPLALRTTECTIGLRVTAVRPVACGVSGVGRVATTLEGGVAPYDSLCREHDLIPL